MAPPRGLRANKPLRHNRWTEQEMRLLEQAVNEELSRSRGSTGFRWSEAASKVGTRDDKQCRSRWTNYGVAGKQLGNWEHREELIICSVHALRGTCWSKMAKILGNRTENALKNRWCTVDRSSTSYHRPCSILWHYIVHLKGPDPGGSIQAFKTAVAQWEAVVPDDLAAHVLQQFRAWQDVNQPVQVAVAVPPTPSTVEPNIWVFFDPDIRNPPRDIAGLRASGTCMTEALEQVAATSVPANLHDHHVAEASSGSQQHGPVPLTITQGQQPSSSSFTPAPAGPVPVLLPALEQPAVPVHFVAAYPHAVTGDTEPASGSNSVVQFVSQATWAPLPATDLVYGQHSYAMPAANHASATLISSHCPGASGNERILAYVNVPPAVPAGIMVAPVQHTQAVYRQVQVVAAGGNTHPSLTAMSHHPGVQMWHQPAGAPGHIVTLQTSQYPQLLPAQPYGAQYVTIV